MPALEPCVFQSGDQTLLLRTATEAFEIQQLRGALSDQHYLGAGKAAGHVLWQGVYRQDSENPAPRLLAVLCWAGAAKRLKAMLGEKWNAEAMATLKGRYKDGVPEPELEAFAELIRNPKPQRPGLRLVGGDAC